MARKIIVTAALTGAFQGKAQCPGLPEQPDEIAQAAYECYNAGASIVHLHARDKNGINVTDPKIFSEINSKIRAKCPIITQDSTAPATRPGFDPNYCRSSLEIFDAEFLPEMASLDVALMYAKWQGEGAMYAWTRDVLIEAAKKMQELKIKPEIEIFSPTNLEDVEDYLLSYIPQPLSYNIVMGMSITQGAMKYSPENLMDTVKRLPKGCNFSVMHVGARELEGAMMGMLLGGGVRVGLEDNIWYRKGEKAKSNAQLVERAVRMIREFGFEIATPDEAREILNIPPLSISGR
ncbi:MAG: 3-keto-5-aminohexanoate cleavage protein [Eubacterium sp.]|nr:3-keto-5-aminohexanoate cleavage protein [Eubacterium sp.]